MLERNYVERPDSYAHSPFVEVSRQFSSPVSPGVLTRVPFDFIINNENGVWDNVNHWFVAPKSGRVQYNVCANIADLSETTTSAFLVEAVLENAAGELKRNKRFSQLNNVKATLAAVAGSSVFPVDFGDRLYFRVYIGDSSGNLVGFNTYANANTELTHASIYYLP